MKGQRRTLPRRSVRTLLVGALLSSLLGTCATWTAWARVEEAAEAELLSSTRALFEFLTPYEQPLQGAQSLQLSLNGVTMRVHTIGLEATDEQMDAAFVAFERKCRPPRHGARDSLVPPPLLLGQNAQERFGYCVRPHEPLDAAGLTALLRAFERTGDVSSLGQFFGVYVRSHHKHRRMLTFETEGAFYPDRAFRAEGDVPGRDLPQLPRPRGRRTLSVELDRRPLITAYASAKPHAALSAYARQLEEAGLVVDALSSSSHSAGSKPVSRPLRLPALGASPDSAGSSLVSRAAGARAGASALLVRAEQGTFWVLPSEGQLVLLRLP